jgi:hypothetical protein
LGIHPCVGAKTLVIGGTSVCGQFTSLKSVSSRSAGVRLTTDIEDNVAGGVCLLVTVANGSSPLAGFSDALAGHRMFGRPKLCK